MGRKKKSESDILEQTEKIVENAVKKTSKMASKIAEESKELAENLTKKMEEAVEDLSEDLSDNKKKAKKAIVKSKLEELKEKAAKLAEKVEDVKEVKELKKKVKPEEEEKKDTLVPMEDYLKSSIHLGTRVITPDMKKYVYRRRADGLAVFNTARLDDEIREGAEYLASFAPEEIITVCKREAGWKAVELFSQATGIRVFTKKYPSGILTNTNLKEFTEANLIFICDPWIDKNALDDANRIKIPVLSICDTNNYTQGIKKIIPGNNKSAKSLGMILYLMTKLYVEKRKIKADLPPISEWIDDWDNLQPPK